MFVLIAKDSAESSASQELSKSWLGKRFASCKRKLATFFVSVETLRLVLGHRSTPIPAKIVAALALGYLVSPIQLIPSFIPVIGQLDDLLMVLCGITLVRKLTPATILKECEEQAESRMVVFRARHNSRKRYAPSTEVSR